MTSIWSGLSANLLTTVMTSSVRASAVLILLATFVTTHAVTSPEEANAACALENDAVASCDEFGDGNDASRRLQGDDDDAATFCSFAGTTLAAQCDPRDTCGAEYRAYLTCYYRALCEDPTLGCAPLAADDPPATVPPATASPAPSYSPAPTATPAPTASPMPTRSPAPTYSPAPTATHAPTPPARVDPCRSCDGARGLTAGLAAAAWLLVA